MKPYLYFVLLTILCWGAYVPTFRMGQKALDSKSPALWAFLFVGIAYFLTAVLVPLAMLGYRGDLSPFPQTKGWTIALIAGVFGAMGALGVNLAMMNGGKPNEVASLVFAFAPIVATMIEFGMHKPENAPPWQFFAGILLAAVGAGLVLRYRPS